jgi:hypothetical protein
MEKANKCQIIQRVKNWLVWRPLVFHWKYPELGQGEKPTNISIIAITIKITYNFHDRNVF